VLIKNQKLKIKNCNKMNRQITIRAMAAIALILAASIHVQAQLGGALNRAKEAVQSGSSGTSGQQTTTAQPAQTAAAPAATAQLPAAQRAAIEKLNDESKRTAPKVAELVKDADSPGGAISKFFEDFDKIPVADIQAFKAKIEARNTENIEIFGALWEVPGNAAEFVENSHERDIGGQSFKSGVSEALSTQVPANNLLEELANYKRVMGWAQRLVNQMAKVKIDGDLASGKANTTVEEILVGQHTLGWRNEQWVFLIPGPDGHPIIAPADDAQFQSERAKYTNAVWLLNKAGSNTQYHEYWVADIARGYIFQAQRNSIAMETKLPVPAAQMNDAALTARMLKMAQDAYPTWGVVRLIIAESAWRPETNALGQIIHRRINTKIILPRSSGEYIMRTLSFIEPYSGGGTYGEARPFGIGTDEVAVDYK
jgi:hypothetical protein